MRTLTVIAALGACLAIAGCSKPTQEKTGQDLKAVGSDVGSAAKEVAGAPAMKELGSDIKSGAQEAAAKTKDAADKAGEELKAGAKEAGAKTDAALNKANSDVKK